MARMAVIAAVIDRKKPMLQHKAGDSVCWPLAETSHFGARRAAWINEALPSLPGLPGLPDCAASAGSASRRNPRRRSPAGKPVCRS